MQGELEWRFQTRQPRIAYTRFADNGLTELWMGDLNGENIDVKEFVSEQNVDSDIWKFVVGNENPIYDIDMPMDTITGISKNLLRDNALGENFGGKTYYKMILLIDKHLKVRGIYQGDQTPQLKKLRVDIRNLYNEYKKEDKASKLIK